MGTKKELTKETIQNAINKGAKSISQIYKMHGGSGNISGSTTKKIREIIPDIQERLNANKNKPTTPTTKPAKAVKPTTPKQASRHIESSIPRAKVNPFRTGSAYSLVFDLLHQKMKKGISRMELLKMVVKASKKPEALCRYDISVVLSCRKDGSCHRSAKGASDVYWMERQNDWLKLHLRNTGI